MFFYDSKLNCVCQSPSFDSVHVTSLLTFDSFDDAKEFLLNHRCEQFHKSTFYYEFSTGIGVDDRTFVIRKFYGMNYYGIVCYVCGSRFYLPRIYEF